MRRWALVVTTVILFAIGSPVAAQDLSSARQQAQAAQARYIDAQNRANRAQAAYFEADSKLSQLAVEIERQEADLAATRDTVERLRGGLRAFLVDQYTTSSDQLILFSMSDINRAVVQQTLTSVIANRQGAAIDEFRQAAADLQKQTEALAARRSEQTKQLATAASIRDQLNSQVETARTEKANFDALVSRLEAAEQQRLREEAQRRLEEARRAQEEEARRRAATPVTTRPPATTRTATPTPPVVTAPPPAGGGTGSGGGGGGLAVCPVQGGASFTDTWGQARSGGRRHLGVDLSAPIGTPVVAPVAGSVSYSGDGAGGLTYLLSGNDGNFYYGAHLSRYGSATGAVAAGTVIGYVGMTGNASVPHLHFEIHLGGRGNAINPYPATARVC